MAHSRPPPTVPATAAMAHRTIHMFNKGLRLHDNPTLVAALESSSAVYPVFVLDRAFMEGSMRVGSLRWRFILQSLEDLHRSLQRLGSRLYVLQGSYKTVLRRLVTQWGITQLSFDAEVEPHYKRLDEELRALASELGLGVISCVAHTLYDVKRYAVYLCITHNWHHVFVQKVSGNEWVSVEY